MSAQNGPLFPDGMPSGNRVPESGPRTGHTFRLKAIPKSLSHSERQFWDAVSADTDDDLPPISHAFKHAIQKRKTADRLLFLQKSTRPETYQAFITRCRSRVPITTHRFGFKNCRENQAIYLHG